MISTKSNGWWSGETAIRLFIAAQIGVPVLAHIYSWMTGVYGWWGWQMFSR